MSFPACRHAKAPASSAVSTLRWLAAEPFRVFFLSGAIFSIAAVLLWPLFYAGWLGFYPAVSHARLMVQGFAGGFVIGFLGTAGPRMLAAPRFTPGEAGWLFALHLAGGASLLAGRTQWGDALFLALLVSFVALLGRRMLRNGSESPPPAMLLTGLGLACGIAGTAMWLHPAGHGTAASHRLAGLLLYHGFLLGPVMGVGTFLLPHLLGGDFGEPAAGAERRRAWRRTGIVAIGLMASFGLEVGWHASAGVLLRAAVFAFALAGIGWRRGEGTLARALLVWCLPLAFIGIASPAAAYARHVALDHLLFIGGFGLLCLIVGSRVLFGHSGLLPDFGRRSNAARWIVGLIVIAAATRASAEFWPRILVSHHNYAVALWTLGVAVWLGWHRGRFFRKDPDPG